MWRVSAYDVMIIEKRIIDDVNKPTHERKNNNNRPQGFHPFFYRSPGLNEDMFT